MTSSCPLGTSPPLRHGSGPFPAGPGWEDSAGQPGHSEAPEATGMATHHPGTHAASRCGAGPGSPDGGEGEDGIDGGFDGAGVALDLGEEQPALERGEQRHGEVIGTGAGREVPGGLQGAAAPSAGAPGGGDGHVPPGLDAFGGTEPGPFVVADDNSGLMADDRLDEFVLAGESSAGAAIR